MNIKRAKKWLQFVAIAHIVGGILLPLLVFSSLSHAYFEQTLTRFPNGDINAIKFFVAIFGPTVASWGLLFLYALDKAFRDRTSKDWWFLLVSILVWGVLDSGLSFYYLIYSHLVINGIALLMLLLPLLIVKKHFIAKP